MTSTQMLVAAIWFAAVSISSSGLAQGSSLKALSLEKALELYRARASLGKLRGALDQQAAAREASDTRRLPGPLAIGLSGDSGARDKIDGRLELLAKKRIAFGVDTEAVRRRYQLEAKAELLSRVQEARERELEVANLYARLRQLQAAVSINSATLSLLEPLEKKAKVAARLGTLGGFSATRLRLSVDAIRSELTHAKNAYAMQAKAFSKIIGSEVSSEAGGVTFSGPVSAPNASPLSESSFLPLAESAARREALAAQATQVSSSWEIEAGVGIARDFETKVNAVVFELDIPLGVGLAARSEVNALVAEQASLTAAADVTLERAKDQVLVMSTDTERLRDAGKILAARIVNLESLLGKAQGAFRRGQGDIAEVLETARELHEAKLQQADLQKELDEAVVALAFYVKGDVP